jgi:ParB family chromosome partitioning protein
LETLPAGTPGGNGDGHAPVPPVPAKPFPVFTSSAPAGRSWSPEFLEETKIQPGEMVIAIPLGLIARNPYQTRVTSADDPALEEVADSIKAHGVMQPVVVRPMQQAGPLGELYELIAGERRWLASRRAGKSHIPAIVRDVPSDQVLVLTIIENLHRQDLNPMQHARALDRLAQEFRLTQEEVAARTGLARSAVANYLRLGRLPEELQAAVADGRLGFGQAKVLLPLETSLRDVLARKVIAGKLTVRETEALVQDYLRPKPGEPPPAPKVDPNVRAAEMELRQSLGCRVQIKDRNGKGKIVIEYNSLEDFDRVLEMLK